MAGPYITLPDRFCETCGARMNRIEMRLRPKIFAKRRVCSRECAKTLPRKSRMQPESKTHKPEFFVWRGMIRRCHDGADENYARYGGRGITVCQRWRDSFDAFFEDMGSRPSSGHSLDRENNDLGYTPENCRWVTIDVQARNKRSNIHIEIDGVTKILQDWCRHFGIRLSAVRHRVENGMTYQEALSLPAGEATCASSGFKGVYHMPDRPRPWQAKISSGRKQWSLGYYSTKEEASAAYWDAKARLASGAASPRAEGVRE